MATVGVDLNATSAQTLTVRYATHDGTATADPRLHRQQRHPHLCPGVTATSIAVPILDDGASDGNEWLTLSLSTPSAGLTLTGPSAATLTLIDDHDALRVSLAAATVSTIEGTNAAVAVTLNTPSSQTVTVGYATHDGTGHSGTDYTAQSGTLTFAPNVVSQTLSVPILDDNQVESSESFTLSLSSPSVGLALSSPATATFVILETDTAPTVAFGESGMTTFEGAGPATLTVNLNELSSQTVTVRYTTNNNTALAGTDYTATSGTLTFAPGTLAQKLAVPLLAGGGSSGTRQFYVSLSTPSGATLGTPNTEPVTLANVTSTLLAAFAPVGFSILEDSSPFTATVLLNTDHAATVTLDYNSLDNTAHAGTDYTATHGTLTFAPHVGAQSFAVPILDDGGGPFNTRNFGLVLSTPSTGLFVYGSFVNVAILDGDGTATPTVNFPVPALSAAESAVTLPVTVTLSTASSQTVTVRDSVSGGTAVSGTDYRFSAGTLTFAPGVTAASFTVTLLDDGAGGASNETLGLVLNSVQGGATLGMQSQLTLTLLEQAPA